MRFKEIISEEVIKADVDWLFRIKQLAGLRS
jgi:hypothetical protein